MRKAINEIKVELSKWRDIPCPQTDSIVKITVLCKFICRLNAVPIKVPTNHFVCIEKKNDSKVYMEKQKTHSSQKNIKVEEQSFRGNTT